MPESPSNTAPSNTSETTAGAPPEVLRAILRQTTLWGQLDDERLDHIASAGSVRTLQRGTELYEQGTTPEECYVVISGRIAVIRVSTEGRESILAIMCAGDLFGEVGFLDGQARSAISRALEESSVLVVPYTELRALYDSDPSALWGFAFLLARRLRTMGELFADGAFLDVMGRTAKRLLELAGENDEFELPVTQEELAAIVGASRERVNKAIHAFVRLGWIVQEHRRYKITNREKLSFRAR